MVPDVVGRVAVGLAVLALWVTTLVLLVRHPVADWTRAGRDKRFWAWAHLVCLLVGLAVVASTAFLVGVWPRLRRAARSSPSGGPAGPAAAGATSPAAPASGGAPPLADTAQRAADLGVLALRRGHGGPGALRRLALRVDGRVAARLRPGEVAEVAVPAGEHAVQARMDWLSSAPVAVRVPAAGTVRVAVSWSAQAMGVDGMLVHPEEAIDVSVVAAFPRW